jgi:surfeit locus 1 family protein
LTGSVALKRLPVYGKWLWATLAVVLGLALLIRLGFWQLDRLAERRAANAHLVAQLELSPLNLTGQTLAPAGLDLRRGRVRGTYDFAQEMVLRNRAFDGAPGVHIITPLRIAGSDTAVLVDRGWIPYDQAAPDSRKIYDQPAGEVEVQGVLHLSQARLNFLSPADPSLSPDRPRLDEWFRVDIPRVQQQIPYPLLSVYLEEGQPNLAALPPMSTSDALPRPDIQIDLSDGPHLSYAIQWFAFAAILLVGYVTLFVKQTSK